MPIHHADDVHGHECEGGFEPLQLTLTGFRGIRDGLGRDTITLDIEALAGDAQLVAIAGANGRGKTTIIENLHPYLLMPSRAGGDGLGAFSYYDHVVLPESVKDLTWRHGGRCFRSQVVIRLAGRRKTEAYLLEMHGSRWQPAKLADGTQSDGRVESYERLVHEVLGPAETFFTSVFAAQGRRALSTYRNSEIKGLLTDLLGLDDVRDRGALAAETSRLLKAGLASIRLEQDRLAGDVARLESDKSSVAGAGADLSSAAQRQRAAQQALDEARQEEAAALAQQQACADVERRRQRLTLEHEQAAQAAEQASGRLDQEASALRQSRAALARRRDSRQQQHMARLSELLRQRQDLQRVQGDAARVLQAQRLVGMAQALVLAWKQREDEALERQRQARDLATRQQLLEHDLAAIEREAGQASLRQVELTRRLGLTAQVPCAGTALQDTCPLLNDARQARSLQPQADAVVERLAQRRGDVRHALQGVAAELGMLSDVQARLQRVRRWADASQGCAARLDRLAARAGEIAQSRERLAAVESELAGLELEAPEWTQDERVEAQELDRAEQRIAEARAEADTTCHRRQHALHEELAALPPAPDTTHLAQARERVRHATQQLEQAQQAHLQAARRQERLTTLETQLDAARSALKTVAARAGRVETELSAWTLLAKCLSNDGVIALDIDDAGPTLAGLANELLMACYGPRFTLELRTQVENAKGESREGFDIIVHDGQTGESKRMGLISGGERVWINECLTRAIALYLARNAGRRFGTLFSDEADGPLDPARKRMFMRMKREVLRLGGYRRELFVTQTPELTAMADQVIDLDEMALTTQAIRQNAGEPR